MEEFKDEAQAVAHYRDDFGKPLCGADRVPGKSSTLKENEGTRMSQDWSKVNCQDCRDIGKGNEADGEEVGTDGPE